MNEDTAICECGHIKYHHRPKCEWGWGEKPCPCAIFVIRMGIGETP